MPDFSSMKLKEDLLRGLYAYGFEKPSAIQQRAVVPILSGRDVIAQAQSGTGKTSMIALTLCQMVDINTRECVPSGACGGMPMRRVAQPLARNSRAIACPRAATLVSARLAALHANAARGQRPARVSRQQP